MSENVLEPPYRAAPDLPAPIGQPARQSLWSRFLCLFWHRYEGSTCRHCRWCVLCGTEHFDDDDDACVGRVVYVERMGDKMFVRVPERRRPDDAT